MTPCLFCKLVSGEIPVTPVIETNDVLAFADINPQAPHHYLVIPKVHVASLADCEDAAVPGQVMRGVQALTRQLELTDYRVVINTGEAAGQSVFHLHAHVLAGRLLDWPPG